MTTSPIPALIVSGTALGGWSRDLASMLAAGRDGMPSDPAFKDWLDGWLPADVASTGEVAKAVPADALPGLVSWLQSARGLAVGIDERALWAVEAIDRAVDGSRLLLIAESPIESLCRWLRSDLAGAPADLLAHWRASALRCVRLAHALGERCRVLSLDELRARPEALAALLGDWLQVPALAVQPAPPAEADDALARGLAALLLHADAKSRQAWEQLHACTLPLPGCGEDAPLGFDLRRDRYAGPALACYREMRACLDGLRQQVAELQPKAESGDKASAENKRLCQQVAELLASKAGADPAEVEELKQENELLLLQLHQVQEELEHYFLEYRKLVQAQSQPKPNEGPARTGGLRERVRVDAVEFGERVDAPPFRGLDVRLRGIRCGERRIDALRVRLVEHHGRPGLAIFAEAAPPLSAWQPSGEEAGTPYQLLVPADAVGQGMLQRLPSSEWRLLAGIAGVLADRLAEAPAGLRAGWVGVAARLNYQLRELPPRLRYDDLQVSRSASGDGLEVRFHEALFGERTLGDLDLHWTPQQLVLRCDPEGPQPPPLSIWPVDGNGRAVREWRLPVAAAGSPARKAQAWGELAAGDRELLCAILDAFPAVPARLPADAASAAEREQLLARARRLLPDAQRSRRGRLAWFIERVLARLGVRLAADG